jgi:FkbM family methyltransferase
VATSRRYRAKRALLAPRRAWGRRRRPIDDPFLRHAVELHSWSPDLFAFIAAKAGDPELLDAFDRAPGGVVLDVGAYDGAWAEAVLAHGPARVLAFEPDPSGLTKLRRRLGDRPEVEICAFGLGAADATVAMALEGPGSHVFATEGEGGTFGVVEVEVRDAHRALVERGVDDVELLKLNIEGAEYDVLERLLDEGWLPRCRHVLVQFHEWHPRAHPRRRAIRARLRETHDEVWSYPWVWERWERRA